MSNKKETGVRASVRRFLSRNEKKEEENSTNNSTNNSGNSTPTSTSNQFNSSDSASSIASSSSASSTSNLNSPITFTTTHHLSISATGSILTPYPNPHLSQSSSTSSLLSSSSSSTSIPTTAVAATRSPSYIGAIPDFNSHPPCFHTQQTYMDHFILHKLQQINKNNNSNSSNNNVPIHIYRNEIAIAEYLSLVDRAELVKHSNDTILGLDAIEIQTKAEEEAAINAAKSTSATNSNSSAGINSNDMNGRRSVSQIPRNLYPIAQSPPKSDENEMESIITTTNDTNTAKTTATATNLSSTTSSGTIAPSTSSPPSPSSTSSFASFPSATLNDPVLLAAFSSSRQQKRSEKARIKAYEKQQLLLFKQQKQQMKLDKEIELKEVKEKEEKEDLIIWTINQLYEKCKIGTKVETKEERDKREKKEKKIREIKEKEEKKEKKREKKKKEKEEKKKMKLMKEKEKKEKKEDSKNQSNRSVSNSYMSSASESESESEFDSDSESISTVTSPLSTPTNSDPSFSSLPPASASSPSASPTNPILSDPILTEHSLLLSHRSSLSQEQLLIYVSFPSQQILLEKKIDSTVDCLVITTQRIIRIIGGKIVQQCEFGIYTGNVLYVNNNLNMNLSSSQSISAASAVSSYPLSLTIYPFSSSITTLSCSSSPSSQTYLFDTPSPLIHSYLSSFLVSIQDCLFYHFSHSFLYESSLLCRHQSDLNHQLTAWSLVARSFIFPILFSTAKVKLYETLVKQAIGKVEGKIKRKKKVEIEEMKLIDFKLPSIEEADVKQLPVLKILAYATTPITNENNLSTYSDLASSSPPSSSSPSSSSPSPNPTSPPTSCMSDFVFDFHWAASDFCLCINVKGRKLVSFELELLISNLNISGLIRLRCSPFDLSALALSFVSPPTITLSICTRIKFGSIQLPFQRAIEKKVLDKLQSGMREFFMNKAMGKNSTDWLPIKLIKPDIWQYIERWNKMKSYQFNFDQNDSENMLQMCSEMADVTILKLEEELKAVREKKQKVDEQLKLNIMKKNEKTRK